MSYSETHNAASLNRASALLALNQFDEAEVSLNHLITNPDFSTQAYALLCTLEIQRGNLEKADEALKAASAQLSDSAALLVAAAHIDLRLYEDPLRAKKRLAQALVLQPRMRLHITIWRSYKSSGSEIVRRQPYTTKTISRISKQTVRISLRRKRHSVDSLN